MAGTWTDGHTQNSVDITFWKLFFAHSHSHTCPHTHRSKNGKMRTLTTQNGKLVNKAFSGLTAKRKVCVLSHATIGTVNGTSWLLKCYLTHKEDCHEQCVLCAKTFLNQTIVPFSLPLSLSFSSTAAIISTFPLCLSIFLTLSCMSPQHHILTEWGFPALR